MIKEYLVIYLTTFIRGLVFLLFGMKAWSIYTCNNDYFEKKFNHVSNFGDIFNAKWDRYEKTSVCDGDTNLDGLGFLKNGFIYSINWVDYFTKRWICYFLNYGLEPFCCDDPKQNCESDSNLLKLPMGKNSELIFSGLISLIKIFVYGILNILFFFPILLVISLMGGYAGAYRSKEDFSMFCYESFDVALKSIPKAPWPFGAWGAAFSSISRLFEPMFRYMLKYIYFFGIWPLLSTFNYAKTFIFMLSGDGCGCNIFTKWKVQNNKIILTRILIPILIWATLMFSKFIFYQILTLKGIASPEIMPKNMFQASLNYYFMKYDIDKLKYKNTNKEQIDIWYNKEPNNYKDNLKELKEDLNNDQKILNKNDTSYNLDRLPDVLAALKIDLKEKNNLLTLSDKFKNNQTVLSNLLEHVYGSRLEFAAKKLKFFAKQKKKMRDLENPNESKDPIPNYNWYGDMDGDIKGDITDSRNPGKFTPKLINLKLKLEMKDILRKQKAITENEYNNFKKQYDKVKKLSITTQYYTNLIKITNTTPHIYDTQSITEENNGSVNHYLQIYIGLIVKIINIPISIMDSLIRSDIFNIPSWIIQNLFSAKTFNIITTVIFLPITIPYYIMLWFISLFS